MAGPFQNGVVGGQVGKAQHGVARLAGAQKFAGAANLQVAPGDLKAVIGLGHSAQALAGRLTQARRVAGRIKQHAGRCRSTPPHAPAQLVQLAQAKALGVVDHHERGVGHVHAYFNYRGADQHGGAALHKLGHHRLLLVARQARMQQAHGELGVG